MRKITMAAMVLALLPAMAAGWETRDGDVPLSKAALRDALVGQVLTFCDDGKSRFYDDGRYSYTYGQGGIAYGHYSLNGDGTACIGFVGGSSRCDLYVRNGDRLVLVTEDGDRFPVRP
ncbi:hypothetical protein [Sediminimonas sp.]|uniref:hypothetical protein n=1 Tax=Sediminimonas sp. TaxID=2823379 RepID=UPI0025CE7FFF|nr:hypothetical protein [Sediminimonas sp.]